MKVLIEFSIILFFYGLGEAISYLLPFNFSGSIIGMVLLFIALLLQWVRLSQINTVSAFFLRYMPLFFIPAGVSVINSYSLIKMEILPIISVLLLSTILVLILTSLIVDFFVKKVEHD